MAWSTQSRHERGYGTEWDRLRKLAMRRDHGMCQCPKCKGLGRVATDVHHIKPKAKGGTDDVSNLICLNGDCHDALHGQSKRKVTGLDGWDL